MISKPTQHNKIVNLEKVLEANLRALIAGGADELLIRQFTFLLSTLRRHGLDALDRILAAKQPPQKREKKSGLNVDLAAISLEQLLSIVSDVEISRSNLEHIATARFGVPRGSMRSFSNRRMLVEKLRSLIRNEQAHATISKLAGQDMRIRGDEK